MELVQFDKRELVVLMRELRAVLDSGIDGDVVELGCYKGETSVIIARLLIDKKSQKTLYAYDSFEGLPPKQSQDLSPAGTQFVAGELPATKGELIQKLKRHNLSNVRVKKAWFSVLKLEDLPDKIAFAFLDGDFYQSIVDSLKIIWPKLEKGSVIVVDDYVNEALPGARLAVDEWLRNHPAKFTSEQSLAIIKV